MFFWTKTKAEYHGEMVDFPEMMAWPKPVQTPHPPILVGGAFPHAARRVIRYGDGSAPIAGRGPDGDVDELLPRFHQMLSEAGRDPQWVPVTLFGATEDADRLAPYRDKGNARVVVLLPSAKSDIILPTLDHWAESIRRVG
jgi:alkanesulfonate monooxygenase SsuD/methylene tetrahydromethanopterin reductase-like flavin-dependent oxidoreductase (luciferase family)